MRNWSTLTSFGAPLALDEIFRRAGAPIHWQTDYSAAAFPLDGLAHTAHTLEQLGRSPALDGSDLLGMLQQRLAPEINDFSETSQGQQIQHESESPKRKRPSELLRSMQQKNGELDFKSDYLPLNLVVPPDELSRSIQQKDRHLDFKNETFLLERNFQPATQPTTLANEQLRLLAHGNAALPLNTLSRGIHQSDRKPTSSTPHDTHRDTSSRSVRKSMSPLAMPPASGALQNFIQHIKMPVATSPLDPENNVRSSLDPSTKSEMEYTLTLSPEVDRSRAFLSPQELEKAMQTSVQMGMLTPEQLARLAGKSPEAKAKMGASRTSARQPAREARRQTAAMEGHPEGSLLADEIERLASSYQRPVAGIRPNLSPVERPQVEVAPPSGPQPHSPTPPPPAEVAETLSAGHVPDVSNTFNVTVHMGNGQETSDQELAERLTRILVDQARRYGVDV
jgi:hypothetical protein